MDQTVTIPARFNGPPDSGNGGYTAGVLAAALGASPAEVTLRAPIPLDRSLDVVMSDRTAELHDGDTLVASVRSVDLDLEPPPPPAVEAAEAAAPFGPFFNPDGHPFPGCFVCGPHRHEGDGLRIFPGPVDEVFAAAWTPPAEFADESGRLPDELVWAALDCPTSAPVLNDPAADDYLPIVLARFAARIDGPVVAGEPHVIVTWPIAVDGRKREAGAAIYAAGGELLGVAKALWIELRAA